MHKERLAADRRGPPSPPPAQFDEPIFRSGAPVRLSPWHFAIALVALGLVAAIVAVGLFGFVLRPPRVVIGDVASSRDASGWPSDANRRSATFFLRRGFDE